MLPFIPLNQGGNDPNLQQAMLFNPNFANQNTHLSNLHGNNLSNFHGLNPNLQHLGQNNQLGVLPQLGQLMALQFQNTPQFHGQINLPNHLRSSNLAASLQQGGLFYGHTPIQNLSPMMGFPNGNQMMGFPNGNQMMGLIPNSLNSGFVGNPQLIQNNLNSGFGNGAVSIEAIGRKHDPSTMGQSARNETFTPPKKSQPSPSPMRTHWNRMNVQQSSGVQQPQVNHVEVGKNNNSSVISQNSASKCLSRNFHGFGKGESSHERFQESQLHDVRNSKGKMRPFNRNGGRGQHNWRERKPQSADFGEKAPTARRRPLPVNYTENEIQQWCEARKKNFPTRANIDKMASGGKNNEDADGDAKLRREQLKEVLAKQAELGVEVAEIPPSYLCEPEERVRENENKRKVTDANGQSRNKSNNKRGRHGRDNRRAKRPKFKNEAATSSAPIVKREPSLLQKLLSADIKRDKSQLLQVFRFMVLNDFFKQWPDKPLEFPVVTVKDGGCGGEVGGEKNLSLNGVDSAAIGVVKNAIVEEFDGQKECSVADELENGSSEEDSDGISDDEMANHPMGKEDCTGKKLGKPEEGEITE